ncbi:MAG: tRNA (adenosine(37)-N6)-threonylcarbamoyltransferase complex dimerization subunit type 1 TsaB [Chloroflexi bacterium]|nr:tRNA (adenosine(37)-N6)-threonylcarbamoyltransferase complex dimerization subunit type 1 TsaB [Chloroflexota bacterium]
MILAIDTATRWLGLALHDGTAVYAETGWRCLNNHTIELVPAVAEMLQRASLTPADLTAVAIAIGPGSYTGLRVGLAVAKGMALANHTPLVGVSTLDIVAAAMGPQPGKLVVVAEAGRTRVVSAVYNWQNRLGWMSKQTSTINTWAELLECLSEAGQIVFAGEITADAVKNIRAASKTFRVVPPAMSVRRAGFLAEIGWQRFRKGEVDDGRTIAPVYLKAPDGSLQVTSGK